MSRGQSVEQMSCTASWSPSCKESMSRNQTRPSSVKETSHTPDSTSPDPRRTAASRRAETPIVSRRKFRSAYTLTCASAVSPSQLRSKGSSGSPGSARSRSLQSSATEWDRRGSTPLMFRTALHSSSPAVDPRRAALVSWLRRRSGAASSGRPNRACCCTSRRSFGKGDPRRPECSRRSFPVSTEGRHASNARRQPRRAEYRRHKAA